METTNDDSQTFNYWKSRWKNNEITTFHRLEPNEYLVAHKDVLPVSTKSNCKLFVPLCGKTVDLAYLEECGYDVYGCEFVEKAVIDFFTEQRLEFDQSRISKDIVAFKAKGKNITIYQGDFFALNSELIGKFDAVWDRGSLIAIDPSLRKKYTKHMRDLLAENCKYLLYSVVVTGELFKGPPFTIHHEEIKSLFGDFCDVQHLETKNTPTNRPNADSLTLTVSLLSKNK